MLGSEAKSLLLAVLLDEEHDGRLKSKGRSKRHEHVRDSHLAGREWDQGTALEMSTERQEETPSCQTMQVVEEIYLELWREESRVWSWVCRDLAET